MSADDKNEHQQKVFAHWGLLNHLAKRRFPEHGSAATSGLADEALLYVLNKLEENDWFRVRQHRELSSFPTFLALVTQRLLEDFWRHKYGRSRVPAWIKALGPLWEQIYQKLCHERLPATAVIEGLRTTLAEDGDPVVLWEIVAAIRARIIDCGAPSSQTIETPLADYPEVLDIAALADRLTQTPSVEDLVAAEQRIRLLGAVAELLMPEPAATGSRLVPNDDLPSAALRQLRDTLTFTAEERLLLRLVFQEGLAVTEAGNRLGLNPHQTHGRLRRLLERIRSALQTTGLDRTFKALLEDADG